MSSLWAKTKESFRSTLLRLREISFIGSRSIRLMTGMVLAFVEAAMLVLDQNNAGSKWNLAMMQNQATPSGVLQVASTEYNPRGELTDEQFKRVKQEVTESYTGARNAGKPMLLEGNLKWQSISLSPKEMDFINSRNATAIELCIALGVPPEVMGLGQRL